MKFDKSTLRISAIIAGAIALILFNALNDDGPSAQEREFSSWVKLLEQGRKKDRAIPAISLVLEGSDDGTQFHWTLNSSDLAHYEKTQRILELVGETHLGELIEVNPSDPLPTLAGDGIILQITSPAKHYYAHFTPAEIEMNIQLKNLIKLFQLAQIAEQSAQIKIKK